ncbi:BrxE family protein [Natronomonas amylolytica]|uniref:BrxE family protein n=1 Tax=Natronomonas amylolytica TaxID=3108498 RepID=UPI003009AACB
MTSTAIVDAFISTKETLYDVGIEDDFFLDLVASRLLIERVGESNNQDWWESRVLSETGRARLSEVTPKTQLKAQIDLAFKVGRKAEADRLPDDSISLFSFGPQMESRLTAAIEEIKSDDELTLEALEDLSVSTLDEGWTAGVIAETEANISGAPDSDSFQEPGDGESFLLNENGYTQDEIEPEKWRLLTTLLQAYGYCTDQLRVPYYSLESELKSENA